MYEVQYYSSSGANGTLMAAYESRELADRYVDTQFKIVRHSLVEHILEKLDLFAKFIECANSTDIDLSYTFSGIDDRLEDYYKIKTLTWKELHELDLIYFYMEVVDGSISS